MKTLTSALDVKFSETPALNVCGKGRTRTLSRVDALLFGTLLMLLVTVLSCYGYTRFVTVPAEQARIIGPLALSPAQEQVAYAVLACSFDKALDEVSGTATRHALLHAERRYRPECYRSLGFDPSSTQLGEDARQVGYALLLRAPL